MKEKRKINKKKFKKRKKLKKNRKERKKYEKLVSSFFIAITLQAIFLKLYHNSLLSIICPI